MPLTTEQQLAVLLAPPNDAEVVQYFSKITAEVAPQLKVSADAGSNKGKGVFAAQEFEEGDVVLIEPPLVGLQHSENRTIAMVCDHCCKWLASLEKQAAWRLNAEIQESDDPVAMRTQQEAVEKLETGQLRLPLSDNVQLPSPIACRGGCTALYCSHRCADDSWDSYHQLLCCGKGGSGVEGMTRSGSATSSAPGRDVSALQSFHDHSEATNDTFRLVGRVIAVTLLRATRKLQELQAAGGDPASDAQWQALQYGWEPFKFAHKGLWWECIGVPPDAEEHSFRAELRELASDSLELLHAALYDPRFDALFHVDMFGSIVGMFELNNLGIYVGSPFQQYLTIIDELSPEEQQAVMEAAGPVLDLLGNDVEEGCEGTALYTLQSCMNHSCHPNTHAMKRQSDPDSSAVLLAHRHIAPGEEITISYINEKTPLHEREEALADYGFTCMCPLCTQERAQQ